LGAIIEIRYILPKPLKRSQGDDSHRAQGNDNAVFPAFLRPMRFSSVETAIAVIRRRKSSARRRFATSQSRTSA
jgi:hypothetical protein